MYKCKIIYSPTPDSELLDEYESYGTDIKGLIAEFKHRFPTAHILKMSCVKSENTGIPHDVVYS